MWSHDGPRQVDGEGDEDDGHADHGPGGLGEGPEEEGDVDGGLLPVHDGVVRLRGEAEGAVHPPAALVLVEPGG